MDSSRHPYGPRIPYVTILAGILLVAIFAVESHPNPHLAKHNFIALAFSSWTGHQLFAELTLLGIGGAVSEQFLARWKLTAYLAIVGPSTVWFAEATHAGEIVAGLSGATTGLIGFGILGLVWWWAERPESISLEVISSVVIVYGAMTAATAVYGVIARDSAIPATIGIYNPATMYDAHVVGFVIGFGYWAFEHYANGTM